MFVRAKSDVLKSRIRQDAREVIYNYNLIKLGLSWQDICEIPFDMAEKLLMLQNEIDTYEKEEHEKEMKKAKNGTTTTGRGNW